MYIVAYNFGTRYAETLVGGFWNLHAIGFKMGSNNAMFGYFLSFWKNISDATDAASSTRHKKICPTLRNGKFGFFGPSISLPT